MRQRIHFLSKCTGSQLMAVALPSNLVSWQYPIQYGLAFVCRSQYSLLLIKKTVFLWLGVCYKNTECINTTLLSIDLKLWLADIHIEPCTVHRHLREGGIALWGRIRRVCIRVILGCVPQFVFLCSSYGFMRKDLYSLILLKSLF